MSFWRLFGQEWVQVWWKSGSFFQNQCLKIPWLQLAHNPCHVMFEHGQPIKRGLSRLDTWDGIVLEFDASFDQTAVDLCDEWNDMKFPCESMSFLRGCTRSLGKPVLLGSLGLHFIWNNKISVSVFVSFYIPFCSFLITSHKSNNPTLVRTKEVIGSGSTYNNWSVWCVFIYFWTTQNGMDYVHFPAIMKNFSKWVSSNERYYTWHDKLIQVYEKLLNEREI